MTKLTQFNENLFYISRRNRSFESYKNAVNNLIQSSNSEAVRNVVSMTLEQIYEMRAEERKAMDKIFDFFCGDLAFNNRAFESLGRDAFQFKQLVSRIYKWKNMTKDNHAIIFDEYLRAAHACGPWPNAFACDNGVLSADARALNPVIIAVNHAYARMIAAAIDAPSKYTPLRLYPRDDNINYGTIITGLVLEPLVL